MFSRVGHQEIFGLQFNFVSRQFVFSKKANKLEKSSPSIWRDAVTVKSTVNISSIFVAFLENMNFTIVSVRKNIAD